MLEACQLGVSCAGTVPSSCTLVTWYEYWFQIGRVPRQPGLPSTCRPRVEASLPSKLVSDGITISAWPSLSTSATTGYSWAVFEVLWRE